MRNRQIKAKLIHLAVFFFLVFTTYHAQSQYLQCDALGSLNESGRLYMQGIRAEIDEYVTNNRSETQVDIPIKFHLLRYSDGSHFFEVDGMYYVTLLNETADTYVDYLNYAFRNTQFQFYRFGDICNIDNTNLISDAGIHFPTVSNISSCVNLYIHPGVEKGGAINPLNELTGNVIENNTITLPKMFSLAWTGQDGFDQDRLVVAHEMGHSFGLNHTFIDAPYVKTFGQPVPTTQIDHPYAHELMTPKADPRELVIRAEDSSMPWYELPNWLYAADFCDDTPADCEPGTDPGCNHNYLNGIVFGGTYLDYNDKLINPNVLNLMSYYSDNARDYFDDYHFTSCQSMIMDYTYLTIREDQYNNENSTYFEGYVYLNGTNTIIPGAIAKISSGTGRYTNTISSSDGKIMGVIHDENIIKSNTFKPGIIELQYVNTNGHISHVTGYRSTWEHWIEGISVVDKMIINNHVNHSVPLTTGYQKLAADLNFDGEINDSDIALFGDLLDKKITKLSSFKHPWRFIPQFITSVYNTAFHSNPFSMNILGSNVYNGAYTEENYQYALTQTQLSTMPGYRGIKIGKVGWENFDAIPSVPEIRTPFDPSVQSGEIYKLTFKLDSIQDLSAWQFSMDFDDDKLEFIELLNESDTSILSQPSYFVDTVTEHIHLHWIHESAVSKSISNDYELFTLYVETKEAMRDIFENINLNQLIKPAIFVDDTLGLLRPSIKVEIDLIENNQQQIDLTNLVVKELMIKSPAYPNPFGETLTLELESMIESSIPVQLVSLKGQVLFSENYNIFKGVNKIELKNLTHLNSGLYILRIGNDLNKIENMMIKD